MFDSLIGLAGFCLSVAATAVLVSKSERKVTFALALALLLVLLTGYWAYDRWRHYAYIDDVADAITRTFMSNKTQTIEQIAERVNENRKDPVTQSDLEDAIERERAKGYICSASIDVRDSKGSPYVIRVYKDINFGC